MNFRQSVVLENKERKKQRKKEKEKEREETKENRTMQYLVHNGKPVAVR